MVEVESLNRELTTTADPEAWIYTGDRVEWIYTRDPLGVKIWQI